MSAAPSAAPRPAWVDDLFQQADAARGAGLSNMETAPYQPGVGDPPKKF